MGIEFCGFREASGTGCGCCESSCSVTVCVSGCPEGTPLPNALVTIGGVGSCTTGETGCCSVTLDSPGTYPLTVSATGYQTFVGTVSLPCGIIAIELLPNSVSASITFTVTGCCGFPLPNATCQVTWSCTGSGGGGTSCTTDSSGKCSVNVPCACTGTWTVGKLRFVSQSGSFTIGECGGGVGVGVNLAPAEGYACGPPFDQSGTTTGAQRPDPIKTELIVTDSVYGSYTIVYDPVSGNWTGGITGAFTADCGCPSTSFQMSAVLCGNFCTTIGCGPVSSYFSIAYNTCSYSDAGGFCNTAAAKCPSDATTASCVFAEGAMYFHCSNGSGGSIAGCDSSIGIYGADGGLCTIETDIGFSFIYTSTGTGLCGQCGLPWRHGVSITISE